MVRTVNRHEIMTHFVENRHPKLTHHSIAYNLKREIARSGINLSLT